MTDLFLSAVVAKGYVGGSVSAANLVVFKTSSTWSQARKACKEQEGDLAALTTYEAIDSIKPFVDGGCCYWVGAENPTKKTDAWTWLTGEPIPASFAGWSSGQPNGGEDCLAYLSGMVSGNQR